MLREASGAATQDCSLRHHIQGAPYSRGNIHLIHSFTILNYCQILIITLLIQNMGNLSIYYDSFETYSSSVSCLNEISILPPFFSNKGQRSSIIKRPSWSNN